MKEENKKEEKEEKEEEKEKKAEVWEGVVWRWRRIF